MPYLYIEGKEGALSNGKLDIAFVTKLKLNVVSFLWLSSKH